MGSLGLCLSQDLKPFWWLKKGVRCIYRRRGEGKERQGGRQVEEGGERFGRRSSRYGKRSRGERSREEEE